MTMPNFLIIGSPKSATTSLYEYLKQHPEIYMSPNKEPHFFAFEGKQPDFVGPGDAEAWINKSSIVDLTEYQKQFEGVTTEKAIGEASTMYLYLPEAIERIKYYIPDVKLIAILRHPVDRAYSHFLHLRREGRERLTDFSAALREEEQKIKNHWSPVWHYQTVGLYSQQIQRYYHHFERKNIKIYLYDDWVKNSNEMLKDIFTFLEVKEYLPDMSVKHNTSSFVLKNKRWNDWLTKPNPIKNILKQIIPAKIRKPMAAKAYRKNMELPPKLSLKERNKAIAIFREEIIQLQTLINRDLSAWL